MDAQKLIKEVGAELVSNRAILNREGKRTVIAKFMGGKLQLTAEGEQLALEMRRGDEAKKVNAATKTKIKTKTTTVDDA